jgi:hypothetical protein
MKLAMQSSLLAWIEKNKVATPDQTEAGKKENN